VPKRSAGLLLYREKQGALQVFLVHPGGPFWAGKDDGSWSIPKGELADSEDPLEAAKREFREETSLPVSGEYLPLEPVRQAGGKIVYAWAVRSDVDPDRVKSNTFSLEWPKGSGKMRTFPEIDRGGWFPLDLAKKKILRAQRSFLDQLAAAASRHETRNNEAGNLRE
jgi:predicted NUDIX family NTP pyrophosphohydrolase